ncbi:MAG: VWA domain-containing protein, partial [Planctomycetes bacterium]|nr:VWA domain-containing protein [Planctomycetota bacterium]
VDWNVTARVGRPFVKKFVEERELTVLFLLDVSSSMGFGTNPTARGAASPAREARTVAATAALFVGCVAFAAARNNDKAGLITFTDDVGRYVPAKKGRNHVLRLIREALVPPAQRQGTDLRQALDYAGRVQRKHAIVFVISDFLTPGGVGACERELRLLGRRHEVIAVRVRDPFAAGMDRADGDVARLPNAGLLHLVDPETGGDVVVDTTSRRVRDELRRRWRREREAARDTCRRCGVDLLDVPTEGSVADPLVRFFRMRELRGAKR